MSNHSRVVSEHTLSPGTILHDNYIIERVLGEGGFGITYYGTCTETNTPIAIKEFFPSGVATRTIQHERLCVSHYEGKLADSFERGMHRFLNEAHLLKEFHNLGSIVSVFDVFEENGTAYIVMEYIEGITLKQLIDNEGTLPFDEMLSLFKPVLLDLHEVHKKGLIHRDISPDNLIVGMDNHLHLIDFGAASFENLNETKTMTVILKSGYAPPEQYISDGRIGAWTDVYGICATMYMVLNGVKPADSIRRMQEDTLDFVEGHSALEEYQKDTILRGLRLNYAERFSSTKLLYQALTTAPAGEVTETVESAAVSEKVREQIKGMGREITKSPLTKKNRVLFAIISFLLLIPYCTLGAFGFNVPFWPQALTITKDDTDVGGETATQHGTAENVDDSNENNSFEDGIYTTGFGLVGHISTAGLIIDDNISGVPENVIWKSDNPDIVTIDATTGEMTYVGAGQTTITATYEGKTYSSNISVANPDPTTYPLTIKCYEESLSLTIGGNITYENQLHLNYNLVGDYPGTVNYTFYTDPDYLVLVSSATELFDSQFDLSLYPYEVTGDGTLNVIAYDEETNEILGVHILPVTVNSSSESDENSNFTETSSSSETDSILTMIDVTGQSLTDAQSALTALDDSIEVTVTEEYNSEVNAGLVISQSIAKNTQFTKGQITQIQLVVSKGPMPTTQAPKATSSGSSGNNNSNNSKSTSKKKDDGYSTIHLD